jgi:serine/threonine protein kinase
MLLLDDIIKDDFGVEHLYFKELLKFMPKIDPNQRLSANECLKHPFFSCSNFLSEKRDGSA